MSDGDRMTILRLVEYDGKQLNDVKTAADRKRACAYT